MKLRSDLIALCDYAIVDQQGKLSVLGIFNQLNVVKFPGGLPKFYFVASILGEPFTSYTVTFKAHEENSSKLIANKDGHLQTGASGRTNLIIDVVNVAFEKVGNYAFSIYDGETKIATTKLEVLDASKQKVKTPN